MTDLEEKKIREEYADLTRLLISRKLSITTMESATSGQIASLITDTEGSSAIIKGALVTYSNSAKIQMGVPAEVIEKYSVYSKETALTMSAACKRVFGAHIGIGLTGTMGNIDPANPESSVPGQVYFAIDYKEPHAYFYELPPQTSRFYYKLAVAELVLQELMKII